MPGGGVLPYITYTGMCRPTGLWFWSSWFRTGYPFQRRFLERGITNCGPRLYLLLKIVADYEEAFMGGTYLPKKYPSAPPPGGLMRDIIDWNSGQFCLNVYCLNENRYLCIKCKERSIDCTSALMFVLPILRLSRNTLLNIYRALFILWFDSLGTGVKNTFNKNLIAPEKSSPFHIFSQQES